MTTGHIVYGGHAAVVAAQRFVAPDGVEPTVLVSAYEHGAFARFEAEQKLHGCPFREEL